MKKIDRWGKREERIREDELKKGYETRVVRIVVKQTPRENPKHNPISNYSSRITKTIISFMVMFGGYGIRHKVRGIGNGSQSIRYCSIYTRLKMKETLDERTWLLEQSLIVGETFGC